MKLDYEMLKTNWVNLNSALQPPGNEDELNELIDLADTLMDDTGGDRNHPLYGLLEIVGNLIAAYEDAHIPEPEVEPLDRLKYLMEEHGLRQRDLVRIGVGSRGVVSELLSGKRDFNKRQIMVLSEFFKCGPAVFFPST
jgi:HTH-type transcriptional regulator/antitoxin HigA